MPEQPWELRFHIASIFCVKIQHLLPRLGVEFAVILNVLVECDQIAESELACHRQHLGRCVLQFFQPDLMNLIWCQLGGGHSPDFVSISCIAIGQ